MDLCSIVRASLGIAFCPESMFPAPISRATPVWGSTSNRLHTFAENKIRPPTTVSTHDVDGHRLSLGEQLPFSQQQTSMRRGAVVPVNPTQSTPLQPALTSAPLPTVPQSRKIAPTTTVPPDDFYQPSSRTLLYPPRVPLDYRLVAKPVACIRDVEDYNDTEHHPSSCAPSPNYPTATTNPNTLRVPPQPSFGCGACRAYP